VCVNMSVEFGELKFDSSTFDISAAVHPQGLTNLTLFGSRQGRLQLWNINTSKLLYTFTGWDSPVTTLEQVLYCSSCAGSVKITRVIFTITDFANNFPPYHTCVFTLPESTLFRLVG